MPTLLECFFDARGHKQVVSWLVWMLAVVCCLVALTAASLASVPAGTGTGIDSLDEHSGVIIWTLASLVVILFSTGVGLVIWNISDMKGAGRVSAITAEKAIKEIREEVAALEDKHDGDLARAWTKLDQVSGLVMEMRPEHQNLLTLSNEVERLRATLYETRKIVIEVKAEHDIYKGRCKEDA